MINEKQNKIYQFINSQEENNPKTLSIRLKEMEKLGLVERKVFTMKQLSESNSILKKELALQSIIDMM